MRRSWPLTARGTGAVVLALACFAAANQLGLVELVFVGLLLVSLVVAALVAVFAARGRADVTRTVVPAVPDARDEVEVTVRVGARTALPTSGGRWRDTMPEGIEGGGPGTFPAVSSGFSRDDREVVVGYRARVLRRGIHWIGPFEVSSLDPFGIARRTVAQGDLTRLVVTPAVEELVSLAGVAGASGGTLSRATNRLGQGTDDVIARPWAPGDSMRRIHWRASAHRDELMVRQEEQESSPEATIVFDRASGRFSPEATEATGSDSAFEAAVGAVASALARLVADGYTVALVEPDGVPLCDHVEPADAPALEAAMLMLATVQARLDDRLGALSGLFAGETTGPLVLVTGALSQTDAAMLATVGHHSAFPVLLSTAPAPGAFDAASGWTAAVLGRDVADAWRDAVSERLPHAG